MPTIFLSHTGADKPFVEKLARDLEKIGARAWFDRWEIKVGESITWKVNDGIQENEFLAVVLSPEALESEWVRAELGAAFYRQMKERRVVILPILLRDCEVPVLLADRKYADFRSDYDSGLRDLAAVLGIKQTAVLSPDNWRWFASRRIGDWRKYREAEFKELVTGLVDLAKEFGWSGWVGGSKQPFSITLRVFVSRDARRSISLKLSGKSREYRASLVDTHNPNHLKLGDFDTYVGNTVNECKEFVWRRMNDFHKVHGRPDSPPTYQVFRFTTDSEKVELALEAVRELSWYQGDEIL
ncbi:MAG: toll/interleukin-1 receptor domain-containing protein [Acidobacteriota bacterium]